jgi:hypothetical protein
MVPKGYGRMKAVISYSSIVSAMETELPKDRRTGEALILMGG